MLVSFCKSTIFSAIATEFHVDPFSGIRTKFKGIFKKWPSWIRRCCFHGFLPLEGDLTTKLTMYNNSQTCKHSKKAKFWFSLNFQNIIRRSPQASPTKNWKIKSAVKEKIRDLSTSLNNFGSLKKQRGGALKRPAPFVFLWLPHFFELLLKSRIFLWRLI